MKQFSKKIQAEKLDSEQTQKLFDFSLDIEGIVTFGIGIIDWDLEKQTPADEDLPAILFLRNFIEQIDAISILVRNSSIEPCKNLLRTGLENFFYLSYLLEKDTYNRSMSFLIWNSINNNKNLSRLIPTTTEYKELEKLFLKDKQMKNNKPITYQNAEQLLKIGLNLVSTPKYEPFKFEYEKTKKRLKKSPPWYSLFDGPKTIKELSEYLEHHILYDGFFKHWSSSIHGTNIIQGKIAKNETDNLEISRLRRPEYASDITKNCFNISLMAYDNYIKNRIPEKKEDFSKWYSSIQKRFLNPSKSE